MEPITEASSNYNSTSAIELWLSVPRLLGVWLCRYILIIIHKPKIKKNNRGIPDFLLRNCLNKQEKKGRVFLSERQNLHILWCVK